MNEELCSCWHKSSYRRVASRHTNINDIPTSKVPFANEGCCARPLFAKETSQKPFTRLIRYDHAITRRCHHTMRHQPADPKKRCVYDIPTRNITLNMTQQMNMAQQMNMTQQMTQHITQHISQYMYCHTAYVTVHVTGYHFARAKKRYQFA